MDDETTAQQQINISVFTPIIYLGILLSCLVAFSIIYRRRKVNQLTKVVPIFGENYASDIYTFLKSQYTDPELPKEEKPHEKVMKAALLRKGVEAIRRTLRLKEAEPVYKHLYQNGLIGDDIFQQFNIQVKFQDLEVKEIVQECESYKKGWAQSFFKVAQEVCFNEALRRRLNAIDSRAEDLSELWELYDKKPAQAEDAETVEPIESAKEESSTGVEVSNPDSTTIKPKPKSKKNKKKA